MRTKTDYRGGQHPLWDDQVNIPVQEGVKKMHIQILHENAAVRRDELVCEGEADLTKVLRDGEDDDYFQLLFQGRKSGEVYLELTFYASRAGGMQQPMGRANHSRPPVNYRPIPPQINTQYMARPHSHHPPHPPQPITEPMSTPVQGNVNGHPGPYHPQPQPQHRPQYQPQPQPQHQHQHQHQHQSQPHPRPPPPHHHQQRPMPGPQHGPPPPAPSHSVSTDVAQRYPSVHRPTPPPHGERISPVHSTAGYPPGPSHPTSGAPLPTPLLSAPFSPASAQRPPFNGYPPPNPGRPHSPHPPPPGQMSYSVDPQRFPPGGQAPYRPYGNRPPPVPVNGYAQPSPHGGYPPRPSYPPY